MEKKLSSETKKTIREKLDEVERELEKETNIYDEYEEQQKVRKEKEKELTEMLVKNNIHELYSLSYNYKEKLRKML